MENENLKPEISTSDNVKEISKIKKIGKVIFFSDWRDLCYGIFSSAYFCQLYKFA